MACLLLCLLPSLQVVRHLPEPNPRLPAFQQGLLAWGKPPSLVLLAQVGVIRSQAVQLGPTSTVPAFIKWCCQRMPGSCVWLAAACAGTQCILFIALPNIKLWCTGVLCLLCLLCLSTHQPQLAVTCT
jgi:hypothetical protein